MTVTAGRVRTTAFVVVGAAWFAMMAGSNVATPLYAIYGGEFGFSKAVLTLVFATYALVLAPSLLVFGQLSDRLGRRRASRRRRWGWCCSRSPRALRGCSPREPYRASRSG